MKRTVRRIFTLLLIYILIFAARVLPRRWGLALFTGLGSLAYRIFRKDRERAIENIARAFPGTDPLIVQAIAKGSFKVLGRNAFDALRLVFLSRDRVMRLCRVEGEEHLRTASEEGNGVIAVTGHIGCWELLAAYFSDKGYKVSVIARDLRDGRLNELLVSMRKRHGIVSVPRGSSAITGYRVLRRGEILGMLLDQDIDVDGVFVPFFGVPAHTPRGAAAFALRSGATVVPVAIHIQPDRLHRITVLPRLEIPDGNLSEEQRIDELTRLSTEAIERLIRIYPQQWVWFHERWRKRPGPGDRVSMGQKREEQARFH
ncbi:MAG: lysophospholipid acyltransferase family protein [bacterium]|nr:MAG: lysophospholipid acyltransferase family protein [bacterium]